MKLTKQKLAEKLDLSMDSIRGFLKSGLPRTLVHGRAMIDEREAAEWFAKQGKMKHAQKLIAIKAKQNKELSAAQRSTKHGGSLEDTIARLKQSEQQTYIEYLEASGAMKDIKRQNYIQTVEALRKILKDAPDINLSNENVMPVSVFNQKIAELGQLVRNDAMAWGNTVASHFESEIAVLVKKYCDEEAIKMLEKMSTP